jgi:hypothetical protein
MTFDLLTRYTNGIIIQEDICIVTGVVDRDPLGTALILVCWFWIRIRTQEGKNDPSKEKKLRNFMF